MPPSKNNRSATATASTAALATAGLGMGALLGYLLSSAPLPAAAPLSAAAASTALSVPASPAEAKKLPPPYDLQAVINGDSRSLSEFDAWLQTASCDEVTRLLMDPALKSILLNRPLNKLLTSRFGEFSVGERFACLGRHLGDKEQLGNFEISQVLSDLARDTLPDRAEEMLALLKMAGQFSAYGLAEALKGWADADLPAVLAFAGKLEGSDKEQVTGLLIGGLAERNLAIAQQQALKLPVGRAKDEAMRNIAVAMAKNDLASSLEWIVQSGAGERRGGPVHFLDPAVYAVREAVKTKPGAAAQLLLDRPGLFEGEQGPRQVSELFKTWAAKDEGAAAAAWLEAHPLSETHQKAAEAALAETRIAKLPLDDAFAQWRTLPDDSRQANLDSIVRRLKMEDPDHAIERVADSLPEKDRAKTLGKLLTSLGPEQFGQAMPYLAELGAFLEANPYRADQLTGLSKDQLSAALKGLPEKAASILLSRSLENVGNSDPERALSLMEGASLEKINPDTLSQIAVNLAQSDPRKASEWVGGFTEGPAKEWAALNLAVNWAKFDPGAATAWVQGLPPGTSRDRASLEAAKVQSMTGSAENALTLASGIQDPKSRAEATGYALQQLWRRDQAAAATSLARSGLSAEDQAALSAKLAKGGFSP